MGVAPSIQAQDAGWSKYDFSSGVYQKRCSKAFGTNATDNLKKIRTATTTNPAIIAHRGVYSKMLPATEHENDGKGLFAAENTILAFQHAQCLGYPGVEIDLKYTDAIGAEKTEQGNRVYDLSSSSKLILAHDENLMRFTNFGCDNEFFNIEKDAEIQVGNHTSRYKSKTCPRIRDMQASTIENNLTYMQTYDQNGRVMYKPNGELYNPIVNNINNDASAKGNSLFLRYVLNQAKNDKTLDRLIWVLDIQNYPTLALAINVVSELNMWNRVIFKVWTEALMVNVYNGQTWNSELYIPEYRKANYVFSINSMNTEFTTGNTLNSRVFMDESSSEEPRQEKTFPTYQLVELINSTFIKNHRDRFFGFEVLIDNGTTPKDIALKQLIPTLENFPTFSRIWGVLRVADYICNGETSPKPCQLSGGKDLYATGKIDASNSWVRLYTEKQATIDARWQHGLKSTVRTQDIRGKGDPEFVSPAKTTAIQSQLR
ncbi:hypothetical protein [uncultured Paraglaciecola sp.]|uniref:hypothetical protein n=1 Tax=uncultured Paraglaciecola sp. TaxID=1765024 RepID=UPI0030D7F8E6|tara:strand:- start:196880 stop:198337 length:1458 start_codon:yes stop_codon:yes gene_type:complete